MSEQAQPTTYNTFQQNEINRLRKRNKALKEDNERLLNALKSIVKMADCDSADNYNQYYTDFLKSISEAKEAINLSENK